MGKPIVGEVVVFPFPQTNLQSGKRRSILAVPVNSDFGCVEWPGGVDLCPEAMHQAMLSLGSEPQPAKI